ncbi:MAG: hypothetical protein BA869_01280 [Desulfuromonadales bacterium C00003107]|nr:MAG: hypothetical protein BA869_01280 [Desulfuromonadales bacterium C00003107]
MNKVFRVIWSKSRDCYVVASELASTRGGAAVVSKALVVALAALCLSTSPASADFTVNGAAQAGATYSNAATIEDVIVTTASTSLSNSGTISADTGDGNAVVVGTQEIALRIDADLTTLTNTGDIVVDSTTVYSNPLVGVVHINGVAVDTLTNSGNIDSTGGVVGGAIDGLSMEDATVGTLDNQVGGIIRGGDDGIRIFGNSTVTSLNNAGLIEGLYDEGLQVEGTSTISSLTNSGTIRGEATGVLAVAGGSIDTINNTAGGIIEAEGTGIYYTDNFAGTLTNAGTIRADDSDTVYGIYLDDDLSGTITNTDPGTITASYSSSTLVKAYGIYVSGDVTAAGLITNSGTINAEAITTDDDTAEAYGIYVSGDVAGSIDNSGTITATAETGSDAYSLYVSGGSGTVDNLAGGLLSGDLYVGGTAAVNNSGTIAIPAGVSGRIDGDYTQTATGTLRTAVEDDSTYGQLDVGGTATLPSNAKIDVDVVGSPSLTLDAVLTDVISAGTLDSDGTFAVTDNSSLFNFSASVDGDTVDLTIEEGTSILDSTIAAGNKPAAGAATTLDMIKDDPILSSSPEWAPVITALGQLSTDQEVSDAVSQTLPLLTASANAAILNVSHTINDIVQARQDANLGLSSGDDFYADKQVWAKPFGSWADQDDRKGVSGFDADSYGIIIGADGEIGSVDRIGAAFAYSRSDVDSNSSVAPNSADIDSYQLAVYGSHTLDERTEINYQADVAFHQTDGRRTISFMDQVAKSDYDSWSVHLGADIDRTFSLGEKTDITPSVSINYTRLESESYSESGADALNLKVDRDNTDELILAVDGKLTRDLSDRITLEANLGVGYDILNEDSSITSAFAGAPAAAFVTDGLDPSPWLMRAGVGLVAQASDTFELSARYDIEARDDFDNQAVSLKLRRSF